MSKKIFYWWILITLWIKQEAMSSCSTMVKLSKNFNFFFLPSAMYHLVQLGTCPFSYKIFFLFDIIGQLDMFVTMVFKHV